MSKPSFTTFVTENQYMLEQLYQHVLELNPEISFDSFCSFVYQYSF